MVVWGSRFWGWSLRLGFWGWGFQLMGFEVCGVGPSVFSLGWGSLDKHKIITLGKEMVDKCYGWMSSCAPTLQKENFHWKLNFAISLMANLLNLYSAYYQNR